MQYSSSSNHGWQTQQQQQQQRRRQQGVSYTLTTQQQQQQCTQGYPGPTSLCCLLYHLQQHGHSTTPICMACQSQPSQYMQYLPPLLPHTMLLLVWCHQVHY
jgi:hypothetical protein